MPLRTTIDTAARKSLFIFWGFVVREFRAHACHALILCASTDWMTRVHFERRMWRGGNISAAMLRAAAAGILNERRRANSFPGAARSARAGFVRARIGTGADQLREA